MGLLGNIIAKGVAAAARNSTIKAIGDVTENIISTATKAQNEKEDIVVKDGIMFIKPTRSSENYHDQNVMEIVQELICVGFENITLKPVNKLSELSKKKYGKIVSVTINGSNTFLGIKRIPASSHILIEYMDFKTNVNCDVYSNITRIIPGKVLISNSTEKSPTDNIENIFPSEDQKRFCSYCGKHLTTEGAKFCSFCGKEI